MRARWLLSAAVAATLSLAACGSPTIPTLSATPPSPRPTGAAVTPAATLPMPSGAAVTLDPSLLSLLPSTVGGVPVTQEPDSFAEAVKDAAFVASIDRAAFAIAVSGGDLASGVVAHVRPGVYSDKMFADWRSSYDDGACAQASGVAARADQTLGGRTTYVTTCGGGLRVYHAYVASQGVIVSLFSTGGQDFGAQLIGGIRG